MIIWHLKEGSILYFDKNLSIDLILTDSLSISIGVSCLIKLIGLSSKHNDLLEYIISFTFVCLFLFQNRRNLQNDFNSENKLEVIKY